MHEVYLNFWIQIVLVDKSASFHCNLSFQFISTILNPAFILCQTSDQLKKSFFNFFQHPFISIFHNLSSYCIFCFSFSSSISIFCRFCLFLSFYSFIQLFFSFLFSLNIPHCLLFIFFSIIILAIIPSYPTSFLFISQLHQSHYLVSYKSFKCFFIFSTIY